MKILKDEILAINVKLSRIKDSKNIDVSENTIKKYINKFFECIKINKNINK